MSYHLPPLSSFRTFEAAARHLSFKRAAEELHVTPSAISQQIKSLESYLGVPLFRRRPNALCLTEDGVRMLTSVRAGLDCFAEGIGATRHEKCPSLTVSAPPWFATRWLVPHLSGFTTAHPDVAIKVRSSVGMIDGLHALPMHSEESDPRQGDAKVEIRFGDGLYPGYRVEKLLTPSYVIVCSPALRNGANPLEELDDLRHHILFQDETITIAEKRPSWTRWLELAGITDIDSERGPRFSNSALVHEAVLGGQGVALEIRQYIEADVAGGRLVVPFPNTVPSAYSYFLVHPAAVSESPVWLAFREWICAEIRSQDTL